MVTVLVAVSSQGNFSEYLNGHRREDEGSGLLSRGSTLNKVSYGSVSPATLFSKWGLHFSNLPAKTKLLTKSWHGVHSFGHIFF